MRSFVYIATVGLRPLFNEVLGTLTPGPTSKLYFGIYNLSLNEIVGPGLNGAVIIKAHTPGAILGHYAPKVFN